MSKSTVAYVIAGLLLVVHQLASVNAAWGQEREDAPEKTKVAILIFEGVELLDFAGPAEIFGACRNAEGDKLFEVFTFGVSSHPVDSLGLVKVTPKYDFSNCPQPDILVIPGGNVLSVMDHNGLLKWIGQQAERKCWLFSVCNGASVLAKLGLLDGLQVTTHHGNIQILELLAPKAVCLPDKRFVDNGDVLTAAGVSAGIDGALYVVAKLKGVDIARLSAANAEFDYWAGFDGPARALPQPAADGTVSQAGRVHHTRTWAVMSLLTKIRDSGVESALSGYPAMLAAATGHDREMIEAAGLTETAQWLLKHGRDPQIGLSILQFISLANPQSCEAQLNMGVAYFDQGQLAEAKRHLKQAIALDPSDQRPMDMLRKMK